RNIPVYTLYSKRHPSIHTVHLYLNPLSDVAKQSLYVRGVPPVDQDATSTRRVKVLASVTEGSDISDDWHPILSVIRVNASSWERERVQQQLQVFLRDLEWGRKQQPNLWKRLHFRRVEKGVRETLRMLERDNLPHPAPCRKTRDPLAKPENPELVIVAKPENPELVIVAGDPLAKLENPELVIVAKPENPELVIVAKLENPELVIVAKPENPELVIVAGSEIAHLRI
ncbi:uncharacterized protein nlrx1, partial [Diretmus argenteus]